MTRYRDFFRDDLVKVAATISDFHDQRRFMTTIVDNTNTQRNVGGRTVSRQYEGDLEHVLHLAVAASFSFEEVPE